MHTASCCLRQPARRVYMEELAFHRVDPIGSIASEESDMSTSHETSHGKIAAGRESDSCCCGNRKPEWTAPVVPPVEAVKLPARPTGKETTPERAKGGGCGCGY
jgi:hypothetical protein